MQFLGNKMEKQIENAKSWFVLAQITIILAGFFFATSGIAWSTATSNLNFGLNLAADATSKDCSKINNISNYQYFVGEAFKYYSEATLTNLEMWKNYLGIGVILIVLSLLFWARGKYLLYRLKNN